MMNQNKKELARRIREIGESLIKNAESIVGNEEYIKSIYISADVSTTEDPIVRAEKEFFPEKFIERVGDFVEDDKFGPNDI